VYDYRVSCKSGSGMRITIEISDRLMLQALRFTGLKTKREVVEAGLKLLVRMAKHHEIRKPRGKLRREGDLGSMLHN
jgi:Arc/MetJ family transcription regulator